MKIMFLIFSCLMSVQSFAQVTTVVFQRETLVPLELQGLIIKQIELQCQRDFVSVSELRTDKVVRNNDLSNSADEITVEYTTEFVASFIQGDSQREKLASIRVKSFIKNASVIQNAQYVIEPIDVMLTSGACY